MSALRAGRFGAKTRDRWISGLVRAWRRAEFEVIVAAVASGEAVVEELPLYQISLRGHHPVDAGADNGEIV